MAAISLDDLDAIGQSARPSKKKKTGTKAKSTAKKAKTAKVVSSVKIKKKKTKSLLDDDLPTSFDAAALLELPPPKQKKTKEEKAAKPKKKKNAAEAEIAQKKKKKKGLPSTTEVSSMEAQVGELLAEIPDVMKQENEQIAEYLIMFTKLRDMARTCEQQYFKSKQSRDVYALMQIYNQMREVIADLRALRDVGQMGEILNAEVITPLTEACGNSLIKYSQELMAWANGHLDPDAIANMRAASDKILGRNAQDMQSAYLNSLDKTVQIFSSSS